MLSQLTSLLGVGPKLQGVDPQKAEVPSQDFSEVFAKTDEKQGETHRDPVDLVVEAAKSESSENEQASESIIGDWEITPNIYSEPESDVTDYVPEVEAIFVRQEASLEKKDPEQDSEIELATLPEALGAKVVQDTESHRSILEHAALANKGQQLHLQSNEDQEITRKLTQKGELAEVSLTPEPPNISRELVKKISAGGTRLLEALDATKVQGVTGRYFSRPEGVEIDSHFSAMQSTAATHDPSVKTYAGSDTARLPSQLSYVPSVSTSAMKNSDSVALTESVLSSVIEPSISNMQKASLCAEEQDPLSNLTEKGQEADQRIGFGSLQGLAFSQDGKHISTAPSVQPEAELEKKPVLVQPNTGIGSEVTASPLPAMRERSGFKPFEAAGAEELPKRHEERFSRQEHVSAMSGASTRPSGFEKELRGANLPIFQARSLSPARPNAPEWFPAREFTNHNEPVRAEITVTFTTAAAVTQAATGLAVTPDNSQGFGENAGISEPDDFRGFVRRAAGTESGHNPSGLQATPPGPNVSAESNRDTGVIPSVSEDIAVGQPFIRRETPVFRSMTPSPAPSDQPMRVGYDDSIQSMPEIVVAATFVSSRRSLVTEDLAHTASRAYSESGDRTLELAAIPKVPSGTAPTNVAPAMPQIIFHSQFAQTMELASRIEDASDEVSSEPITQIGLAAGTRPEQSSVAAGLPHQSSPSQRADSASVVRQIVDGFSRINEGTVELRLAPEELGRVRMYLVSGEHGLTVHIQADRPETLDLMRRNVDELARNLADAGYEGAGFSFGEERQGAEGRAAGQSTMDYAEPDPTPEQSKPPVGADGLDIRI
ncbi:flagellar hook-length control protein FliK [Sagittula sp. S175]|uniref:flagellar hook-length control protein FliK n=1 Tax=Sagittula sp. S175 TaxID=3415129 RepID=UPI003C7E86A6